MENTNIFFTSPHNMYEDKEGLQDSNHSISFQTQINLYEKEEDDLPRFYSLNDIKYILKTIFDDDKVIKNIFDKKENVEKTQHYYFMKNKRKHIQRGFLKKDVSDGPRKRGRKSNKYKNARHCKESPDNICRKIKQRLFKYILAFLNEILNLKGDEKLKKLNYGDNISDLQRTKDLEWLDKSLKEIFSSKIFKNYTSKKKTFNEDKIEEKL